jgi:hypothetical protein
MTTKEIIYSVLALILGAVIMKFAMPCPKLIEPIDGYIKSPCEEVTQIFVDEYCKGINSPESIGDVIDSDLNDLLFTGSNGFSVSKEMVSDMHSYSSTNSNVAGYRLYPGKGENNYYVILKPYNSQLREIVDKGKLYIIRDLDTDNPCPNWCAAGPCPNWCHEDSRIIK